MTIASTSDVYQGNRLLTRQEAAVYLHVAPQTLAKWAMTQQHSLPVVRLGRAVRYRLADLDRFIDSSTEG